ncbi:MAG: hypothetical protein GXY32_06210 [Ruminococcaceae bacterium]|nr:hypothetical protein [Oscillospiraceae bacterium]
MKALQRFFTLLAVVFGAVAAGRTLVHFAGGRLPPQPLPDMFDDDFGGGDDTIGAADGLTAIYTAWRGGHPHLPAALCAFFAMAAGICSLAAGPDLSE